MINTNKWTEEEIKYILDNFKTKSNSDMGYVIGRTPKAIQVKLSKLGNKRDPKYSFNKEFFDIIDNEEKAYWLGFIYADGYIYIPKDGTSHCLGIEIKYSDKNHLEKFNDCIDGNLIISDRYRKIDGYDNTHRMCSIRLYSKKLIEQMVMLGVHQNKSMSITFPELSDELISHFIRGFFDGDGTINVEKRSKQLRCSFTSGSIDFLENLKVRLENINAKCYICKSSPSSNSYQLGLSGRNSYLNFFNYIYDNSTIYLDRKHEFYIANKGLLEYIRKGWDKSK